MSEQASTDTTFDRSCQHWSQSGKSGMDAFYRLASTDYRLLAEQLDWKGVLSELQNRFGTTLKLLDVACGSGQFPKALINYSAISELAELRIDYDLLDPSQFSIDTAKQQLAPPFIACREYCCTLQDLQAADDSYPIAWATHALYCIPEAELDAALDRMLAAFDCRGLGFIAHASTEAHYLKFHELYLKNENRSHLQPFCSGEQIVERLQQRSDIDVVAWKMNYQGTANCNERATVERYLQRCLFDDSLSLQEMEQDPDLGPYLVRCINEVANQWQFPQSTWLCFFGEMAATAERCKIEQ